MEKLNLFLVLGPVDNYLQALEKIRAREPLEKIVSLCMSIKGMAPQSKDKFNHMLIIRELGARPAVQVKNLGAYSVIKLTEQPVYSLVATYELTDKPEDKLICALSECDIICVDVSIGQPTDDITETVSVQGKVALPWVRIRDMVDCD